MLETGDSCWLNVAMVFTSRWCQAGVMWEYITQRKVPQFVVTGFQGGWDEIIQNRLETSEPSRWSQSFQFFCHWVAALLFQACQSMQNKTTGKGARLGMKRAIGQNDSAICQTCVNSQRRYQADVDRPEAQKLCVIWYSYYFISHWYLSQYVQ